MIQYKLFLLVAVGVFLPLRVPAWLPRLRIYAGRNPAHHWVQDASSISCSIRSRTHVVAAAAPDEYWYDDDEEEEEPNHLIMAGNYFKGIDEDVGDAMCRAGVAWSSDWSQVAEALEEASTAFWDVLSKKNISPQLQTICRSVAQELEDISTIEGCSSIGPVASVPNWIAIHGYLDAAAQAYEGSDEDDQHIYDILKKTSLEVEALIESI